MIVEGVTLNSVWDGVMVFVKPSPGAKGCIFATEFGHQASLPGTIRRRLFIINQIYDIPRIYLEYAPNSSRNYSHSQSQSCPSMPCRQGCGVVIAPVPVSPHPGCLSISFKSRHHRYRRLRHTSTPTHA